MADPLYELLRPHIPTTSPTATNSPTSNPEISRYLSRLVSLRLNDLTTTEPQSLAQSAQSNLVSIQALSSRSHRTTTTSSDQLSTLRTSLPTLTSSVDALKGEIPELDSSAVKFATLYTRSKDETAGVNNALLTRRRESALLARQADKAQDILELPSLLSAAIASASGNANATSTSGGGGGGGGANYTQALDLFAHIKRLQILYPESELVKGVVADAQVAMKDMTSNLIASLRTQNIRLAAAIRMIGWLRRVAPELNTSNLQRTHPSSSSFSSRGPGTTQFSSSMSSSHQPQSTNTATSQDEGHFGALFLCARLATFLGMTEALAPLRELADQETRARKLANTSTSASATTRAAASRPDLKTRKSSNSGGGSYNPLAGQQTERYLKRYIEIFREQSFATMSMYRNVFPEDEGGVGGGGGDENTKTPSPTDKDSRSLSLSLPPALQSFPLHLVEIFMSTLKEYLPNITDPAVRESLLMQVLYAANSLGRLGADFSLMIATLYEDEDEYDEEEDEDEEVEHKQEENVNVSPVTGDEEEDKERSDLPHDSKTKDDDPQHEEEESDENPNQTDTKEEGKSSVPPPPPEPEWIAVIKKHRVQAARLEALAAGQDRVVVQRRESSDVAVR
ncbi:uncharacterized protein PV06_02251 [Exophiala oligosperma]|uniref:Conserved oligomeric Golgi complex subunit 8 n=1 Tax=Exophiala oligosperma TaxID=215243 RepID=A0A0D2B323_9EURO|nr:uncharacterized protein PV06_02251 [Exophiala oligosperma]KIW46586.1 hypothetical protein PV06_02251 [Exophiala oligosperma]